MGMLGMAWQDWQVWLAEARTLVNKVLQHLFRKQEQGMQAGLPSRGELRPPQVSHAIIQVRGLTSAARAEVGEESWYLVVPKAKVRQ